MDMGADSGGRRLPPGSALPLQPLCSSGPSFLVSRGGKAAETSSGLCSVQGRAACQAQTPPPPHHPLPAPCPSHPLAEPGDPSQKKMSKRIRETTCNYVMST